MKINIENMDKAIIIAALNGPTTKAQNPNVPLTADEVVAATIDCCNAGASIVHLHVKDDKGESTADLRFFSEIVAAIKAKCDIPVQIGNGLGQVALPDGTQRAATYEERLRILDIEPHMDISAINSGSFSTRGGDFMNAPAFNEDYLSKANERGIPILCQTYDLSHVQNNLDLRKRGALQDPIHFSFVLGYPGSTPAHPKHLLSLLDAIPDDSVTWEVVSRDNHHPMIATALSIGAHIRTGFEDTIYCAPGRLADSNAQLVEQAVQMARIIGREIATVEDARKLWGI